MWEPFRSMNGYFYFDNEKNFTIIFEGLNEIFFEQVQIVSVLMLLKNVMGDILGFYASKFKCFRNKYLIC